MIRVDLDGRDDLPCILNPDLCNWNQRPAKSFAFGSVEAETPGFVRFGGEGVAIGGYNPEDGFSAGVIGAAITQFGTNEIYSAHAEGIEKMLGHRPEHLTLNEGNFGLPLLGPWGGVSVGGGLYRTKNECGIFFHISGNIVGEHGSIGLGTSVGATGSE